MEPVDSMGFRYKVSKENRLRYSLYRHKSSPFTQRQRSQFLASWIGIQIGVVAVISLYFQTWPATITAFGAGLLAAYLTPRWYDRRIVSGYRNQLDNPEYDTAFGERQIVFSPAGIRLIGPFAESAIEWKGVIAVEKVDPDIFVRFVGGNAIVISRESFSGPIEFDAIPKLIEDVKNGKSEVEKS
jgi:hypothetical protein